MRADDEHAAEPERDLPAIPTFFTPDELPEWLRATEVMPTVSPDDPDDPAPMFRGESVRARQAWGRPEDVVAPTETADFAVAATTALAHLVPPPRPAKKRRGLFGLGAALPLLVGAA